MLVAEVEIHRVPALQSQGEDSLEETIRDENTIDSLPVVTIANVERMNERKYRELCAERLIDIVIWTTYWEWVGYSFLEIKLVRCDRGVGAIAIVPLFSECYNKICCFEFKY